MAEDSQLSALKRQIIATDKLVKRTGRLEAKLKTVEESLSEKDKELQSKDAEFKKLKSESLSFPASHQEVSDRQAEIEGLKKSFQERENALRTEATESAKKVSKLEAKLGKSKENVELLEKELKSKNDNIIQREIEAVSLNEKVAQLKKTNETLKHDLANGVQVQNMKEKFEEVKWGLLADINRLKQENASSNNLIEELKKSNESLLKSKDDLTNQLEGIVKKDKEEEKLGKSLERKDKQISSLEKKLDQSKKEIEQLKLKLKSKGNVTEVSSPVEDENKEVSDDDINVDDEPEASLSILTPESTPRPRFNLFKFSGPNARFVIERPQPNVGSRKISFTKTASCIENLPVLYCNLKPKISDDYPNLSGGSTGLGRPPKRKASVDTEETQTKRRKRQSSASVTATPMRKRVSETPVQSQQSISQKKIRTEVSEVSAEEETSPEHSASTLEDFTSPNPVKTRQAHSSLTPASLGISPLNKQKKSEKSSSLRFQQNLIKKVKSSPLKLPPKLSPIKSPQVSKSVESRKTPSVSNKPQLSSSSSTAISGAKAKIFASGLGPLAIEAPSKSVGGRLNQAQLEAAKRRSVPASSVSQMPSVDGFRQSGKEQKQISGKSEKKPVKVSESDIYCPSRKKTNPVKLSQSTLPSEETTKAPVQSDRNTPPASQSKKSFKSKELVSTESDSSAPENDHEHHEKIDVPDKSIVPEVEGVTNRGDGFLNNDLDVSDSDEENDSAQKLDRSMEVESGQQKKESDKHEENNTAEKVDKREEAVEAEKEKENTRFSKRLNEKVEQCGKERLTGDPVTQERTRSKPRFPTKIEELVHNFKMKSSRNFQLLRAEREKLSQQRSEELMYEATVNLLQKQFGHLMGSQSQESFNKVVEGINCSEVMVCDMVCEYLKTEHKDTPLLSQIDSDQPAITRKQQRLFTLLITLSNLDRYRSILVTMTNILWHNMFGFDRMYNHRLNAVQNYGRMFVLCARYSDNADIVKHFVYDLFFFKSPRNHLMVGIVVALWPEIFPKADSTLADTPLVEAIVWCVFNTGPEQYSPEMKVEETKDNFENETGYRAHSAKADSLVIKLISLASSTLGEDKKLEEITKSLLLIGRSKGYRWVHNNIITRLMKSLEAGEDERLLCWVISTLGLMSRIYPAEGRENIKQIYNSVELMLKNPARTQERERSCIYALFHLGYHLQMQVAVFLKTWQPIYQLDEETEALMEDFVGTRGKQYAQKTVKFITKERNNLRKRGGIVS